MDDLISRQAAIEINQSYHGQMPNEVNHRIWKEINELPSANRTGTWILVTNGRGGFECSRCHSYAPSYQDGVEWLSDYCPNCGSYNGGEHNG